ncbi:MAG: hypothetical protein NZQ09_11435, partial [Chloroflexus sp.]|nr:hypothetical protein [Chloroflexus sp.]
MLTTIRYGTLIVALVLVLVGAAAVAPKVKPVAAATATPVAALLNADGTLRVDGAVTGALDLTGWDVALDPARGPVLRPATQTGTAGWEHLGVGPAVSALSSVVSSIVIDNSGKVYVGGLFVDAANIAAADYIARWDPVTQQWSALGSSSSGNGVLNRHVEALAIDGNGNLYVGGWFTDVAGIAEADYVARWNGTAWSALGSYGSGNGALSGAVFDIHVTASSVYVGGNFTDVAGIAAADYIARWDGTAWSALGSNGSGDGALNQTVNAITAQGNNLYVGGSFTNAAGIAAADYIARWDGTAWSALGSNGSGDGALSGFVHTVLATADTVYVGGTFTNAAGISAADYIAVWNGTQWLALGDNGSNDGAINAPVNKLAIAGNNLYVGGNFTDAGGQAAADYLAVWNGTSWTALGNHRAFNDIILDVVVDQNGNVYVGGYFSTTVGQPMAAFIAMWTGSNWEALGRGRSSALRGFVYALAIAPDGKVYVGGWFANAAGIAEADYVAMWEPATQTWSALGSNGSGNGALNDIVTALAIAPDGKVYVGGWFANAAGIAEADYVAMWEPATQT